MTRVERFQSGTKVSDWASGSIAAPLPTTHIDYSGYIAGGTGPDNDTDKFSFPSDTRSVPSALDLSSGRAYLGAASNNSIFAYVAGGADSFPTKVDIVDKFTFPEHVRTTLSTGLSTASWDCKGMSNSGTAGYFTNVGNSSAVDKFAYSNDARSTLSAATVWGGDMSAEGCANGSTAGYWGGGGDGGQGGEPYFADKITKLTFSTDAISTLSATLWSTIRYLYGMSNSGTAAYFSGGSYYSSGWLVSNKYDKLAYSNETTSTLSATMSSQRYEGAGLADSGVAGYACGGSGALTVDKITFSNDTSAALSTGLSVTRDRSGGYAHCEALAQ